MRAWGSAVLFFVISCVGRDPEIVDSDADGFTEDCNESDPEVHPFAFEHCDGIDNNCDERIDEGWFVDSDGDGYGDRARTAVDCAVAVLDDADCDDEDAARFPGASETCNSIDDNCDGLIDESLPYVTLYEDADEDGFGSDSVFIAACVPMDGFTVNGGDCDDTEADTFPGAWELCDDRDNNCDLAVDEGEHLLGDNTFEGGVVRFQDHDHDGNGNPFDMVVVCSPNVDWLSAYGDDCADDDPTVPGQEAEAACVDGKDNDCDGRIDSGDSEFCE